MADIRIDELPVEVAPSLDHVVPVMLAGSSTQMTVRQILALILGAPPAALDTLEELAAALGDDANFAATVTTALAGKLASDASNIGNDAAKAAFLTAIGIAAGAAGDLFYRGSDGLLKRLAKGTAGQVLRQNSALTAPEWTKAWEVIEEGTLAAAAQKDFLSLAAYRRLRLHLFCTVSSDATNLTLLTSTDNGATWANANGDYAGQWMGILSSASTTPTGGAFNAATGTSFFLTAAGIGFSLNEAADVIANIAEFNQASYARIQSEWTAIEASGAIVTGKISGTRSQATARNAIRVKPAGGTFSGHYILEGFRG